MSLLYDDSIAVEFTKVWPHVEDRVCVRYYLYLGVRDSINRATSDALYF